MDKNIDFIMRVLDTRHKLNLEQFSNFDNIPITDIINEVKDKREIDEFKGYIKRLILSVISKSKLVIREEFVSRNEIVQCMYSIFSKIDIIHSLKKRDRYAHMAILKKLCPELIDIILKDNQCGFLIRRSELINFFCCDVIKDLIFNGDLIIKPYVVTGKVKYISLVNVLSTIGTFEDRYRAHLSNRLRKVSVDKKAVIIDIMVRARNMARAYTEEDEIPDDLRKSLPPIFTIIPYDISLSLKGIIVNKWLCSGIENNKIVGGIVNHISTYHDKFVSDANTKVKFKHMPMFEYLNHAPKPVFKSLCIHSHDYPGVMKLNYNVQNFAFIQFSKKARQRMNSDILRLINSRCSRTIKISERTYNMLVEDKREWRRQLMNTYPFLYEVMNKNIKMEEVIYKIVDNGASINDFLKLNGFNSGMMKVARNPVQMLGVSLLFAFVSILSDHNSEQYLQIVKSIPWKQFMLSRKQCADMGYFIGELSRVSSIKEILVGYEKKKTVDKNIKYAIGHVEGIIDIHDMTDFFDRYVIPCMEGDVDVSISFFMTYGDMNDFDNVISRSNIWHYDMDNYTFHEDLKNMSCANDLKEEALHSWHPLDDDYECKDGKITWLTTRTALLEEGKLMNHCVGGYDYDCLYGNSHIGHIQSGDECSTVEIKIDMSNIDVIQHRGFQNKVPSKKCSMILDSFIKHRKDFIKNKYLMSENLKRKSRDNNLTEKISFESEKVQNHILQHIQRILPKPMRGKSFAQIYEIIQRYKKTYEFKTINDAHDNRWDVRPVHELI